MIGYDPRISAQMADWKDRIPAGEIGNRIGPMEVEVECAARSCELKTRKSLSSHRLRGVLKAQGSGKARAGGRPAHGSVAKMDRRMKRTRPQKTDMLSRAGTPFVQVRIPPLPMLEGETNP